MSYANAGIPVIVKETTQEALDKGFGNIKKNYQNSVNKVVLVLKPCKNDSI